MPDQPQKFELTPETVALGITEERAELWMCGTYAPAWFADAQKEADITDHDARRREIVFAVCAAESYLLEWVRDEILRGKNFNQLNDYFPAERKLPVCERWKEVVDHLYDDGSIKAKPDCGGKIWNSFDGLVKLRNGLVHGRASRPDKEGLSKTERPEPTVQQLENRKPGDAVRVVADLIRMLHMTIGSDPPRWLPQDTTCK